MSSLLQFNGTINKRGVGLEFIKSTIVKTRAFGFDSETFETWTTEDKDYDEKHLCTVCGKLHPRIYVAFRKPCGMFGCWVQFRYNGEVNVPDLCPGERKPLSLGRDESRPGINAGDYLNKREVKNEFWKCKNE